MKYDGRYSLKDALIEADIKDLDEGIIGDVMGKIGGALKKKLKGLFGGDSGFSVKDQTPAEAEQAAGDATSQLFFSLFFDAIDSGKNEKEAEALAKKDAEAWFTKQIKYISGLDLSKGGDKEEEK